VAASLAELYVYIHKRLGDANIEQSDVPLAEAEKLLNTLLEAWSQLEETQEEEHHGESLALSA
jgi:flagellin-specific chaperone FliS